MIGSASKAMPTAEGTVMRNTSFRPRPSVSLNAGVIPSVPSRAMAGSITVPITTPKMPSGNWINRNAAFSQMRGPSGEPFGAVMKEA